MILGCGERKSLRQKSSMFMMFVLFNRFTFGVVAGVVVSSIVKIENNYWNGIN